MRRWIKTILFLCLTVCLVFGLQQLFYGVERQPLHSIKGFYDEKPNSLDAIYIGASNVYEFWQAPLAWRDHGIAVYSMSTPGMTPIGAKYMMIEANKTQPNALFIIGINNFKRCAIELAETHYVTDYVPLSKNKIMMVRDFCEKMGLESFVDHLEFFLPMIRFHSGWPDLSSINFHCSADGLKGASLRNEFLTMSANFTGYFKATDEIKDLTDLQAESLNALLKCCWEVHPNVLFVVSPQIFLDPKEIMEYNHLAELLRQNGFPVLNMMDDIETVNLDFSGDFYNEDHTNVHGSIRFTEYLSNYLIEHYGFTDKRGDPAYTSWDDAAARYNSAITPYTMDFERAHQVMDYSLSAPKIEFSEVAGDMTTIQWEDTTGADGYYIYRRENSAEWMNLGESVSPFTDTGLTPGARYTYTVIPYKVISDGKVYGRYSRKGITTTAEWPAPELLDVRRDESGIIISWAAVSGVNDYRVYRRTEDGPWIEIASSVKDLYYVDSGFIPGETYFYTVSAYTNDIQGYRDSEGLSIITEARE